MGVSPPVGGFKFHVVTSQSQYFIIISSARFPSATASLSSWMPVSLNWATLSTFASNCVACLPDRQHKKKAFSQDCNSSMCGRANKTEITMTYRAMPWRCWQSSPDHSSTLRTRAHAHCLGIGTQCDAISTRCPILCRKTSLKRYRGVCKSTNPSHGGICARPLPFPKLWPVDPREGAYGGHPNDCLQRRM